MKGDFLSRESRNGHEARFGKQSPDVAKGCWKEMGGQIWCGDKKAKKVINCMVKIAAYYRSHLKDALAKLKTPAMQIGEAKNFSWLWKDKIENV